MAAQPEKPPATDATAPPSHDEAPAPAEADGSSAPPATSAAAAAPSDLAKETKSEPEPKLATEKKEDESHQPSAPAAAEDAKAPKSAPAPAPPPTATTPNTANPSEGGEHHEDNENVNPLDFEGAVDSNNDLPSPETIAKIADYVLLDRDGKTHTFKSLYTGKHAARRVLIIFVRHFYCGNCQEYLRSLSSSITPDALLRLPLSTFIAVVGCGDPGLIDMYAAATGCPFPIYSDPTRRLYSELGMVRTLALGTRPAYMNQGLLKSSVASVVQGLKQIKAGLALKGGDSRQVGGEFLFEPLDVQSPVSSPWGGEKDARSFNFDTAAADPDNAAAGKKSSETSLDGKNDNEDGGEEKRVTWCHRMRTTRDHAEIPELMEVLGLDGQGMPTKDKKRWSRALETRKGTGLSMASQMSAMKAQAGTVS